jgi:hypothetical protein
MEIAEGPAPLVPVPGVDVRRAKFEPTFRQRELVAMMVANHVPQGLIAMSLDISVGTFTKHFAREIKHGKAHMVARVGVTVLRKALKGNMNAARFWLMTHGGPEWRIASKDAAAEAAAFATPADGASERKVKFYIPENGRDKPEAPEPPTIEGDLDTGT